MSELAIAQWGAGQSDEVKKALGFEKGKTPHQTTIQRLFRKLNIEEIEAAFRSIFLQIFEQDKGERGARGVAIDGKVQKGRLKFEEENGYPIHAVSIIDHKTGAVLTQGHVEKDDIETKSKQTPEELKSKQIEDDINSKQTSEETKSNQVEDDMNGEKTDKRNKNKGKIKVNKSEQKEENKQNEQEKKKQKSELAVAYRLILQIDWKGMVLTGDALYCQRCLCMAILLAGGDYLFIVKKNQPQLYEDLRLLFAPLSPTRRAGEGILKLPEQQAQTVDKGHGRLEIRSIRVSSELKGYSDWLRC